jgi:hypothetical protein
MPRFVRHLSFALVYQAASMVTPAQPALTVPLAAQAAPSSDTLHTVVGVVRDSLNGAPLPGALVTLVRQDRGASGLEIRAYTHVFMDHAARRPMPLMPIAWQ